MTKKSKILLGILIGLLCVGIGTGAYFFFSNRNKPSNEPETESTTEIVTEPTTEEDKKETENVYISFKNEKDIPEGIPEDAIIKTEDGTIYVQYLALVGAARDKENFEFSFRDADNNLITVSVFNFIDSNTGKVSVATFTKEKTRKEVYKNLTLEQFRELTGSFSKDDVYEEGYEKEYIPHAVEETSVVIHDHQYEGFVSTPAKCTTPGVYTFRCKVCGDTYTEPIKATGHQFEKHDTKNATCITEGVITYRCVECGHVETESIPKTDHTWKPMKYYHLTCDECGTTFTGEGTIEHAALQWEEHLKSAHAGMTNITATPTVEDGVGEVCIYCGARR